jgi:hypothetical protein
MQLADIVYEQQYKLFSLFVEETQILNENVNVQEIIIPSGLKKIWGFILDLKDKLSVKLKDLVKLFLNKIVFKFFAKIKFSMKRI